MIFMGRLQSKVPVSPAAMVRNLTFLSVPAFQSMKITLPRSTCATSRYPQLAGAHATLRKVRSDICATFAADPTHEPVLDIG